MVCYSFALIGSQIVKLNEFQRLMSNIQKYPNNAYKIFNVRRNLVDLHLTPTEISNAWNNKLPDTLENISRQLNRPSNYLSLEKIGFLPKYIAEAINIYFNTNIYNLNQEFEPVITRVGCVTSGNFIGTEVSPTPPYQQYRRGPYKIIYPAVTKTTGPILAPPMYESRRKIPFMKD